MRSRNSFQHGFESLEARLALSAAPVVSSLTLTDPNSYSSDRPVTLVAIATDDVAIRGVSFFIDVNADNEWTPGIDRHLGDRYTPDVGTTDHFSLTFIADQDTPGAGSRVRFAANAVDGEGQWPVLARTTEIDIYQRLVVSQLTATPVASTQVQLTATVTAPFGTASTGAQGVTFWYDANGNNAWDAGIDTDLGYTQVATGAQQNDFTITATVDAGWAQPRHFSASARDLRDSPDRFGNPQSSVERQTIATAPTLIATTVLPVAADTSRVIAGETVSFTAQWTTTGVTALTIFRDVNLNGVWDYTIDQPLQQFTYSAPSTGQTTPITIDKSWGSGLTAIGAAIRTDSALGDDAWSPVRSSYFITNFQAWVQPPVQSTYNATSSQSLFIDVTARDDHSVRTLAAFIDMDHDNRLSDGDVWLSNIQNTSYPNGPSADFRVTFNAPTAAGTYSIGFYASDFATPNGPVTFVSLNVA